MAKNRTVDIRNIFTEYLQKEQQFEQEIEKRNKSRHEILNRIPFKISDSSSNIMINREKSHTRNQTLLKDLEMSRARLRTYASYSPTNEELQQISSAYRTYLHKKIRDMES